MKEITHCQECGRELKGEAAYIEMTDKVLCHTCADALDEIAWEQEPRTAAGSLD